jgi:hypothetical protein
MLLAAMLATVLGAPALAGERVGPIEVNVQPLPTVDNSSGSSNGTRHGYLEIRVQLRNSSTKDLQVELANETNYGVRIARTVRVAGGQEVSVSLFQPSMTYSGLNLIVRVEGEPDPKRIYLSSPISRGYNDSVIYVVLVSRGVPQEFRDEKVETPPAGAESSPSPPGISSPPRMMPPGAKGSEPYVFLRSELPVNQWSANWLGYSCFDAVVVTEKEAEEMPPQVQLALRRFIECGGTLIVHAAKAPAVFSEGGSSDGTGGFWVGFGRVVAGYDGDKPDWQKTREKLSPALLHEYHPTQKPNNLHDMLVAETTVPIRGLFVLVLVFGIGIGPANLWLLSRYRRRIWLWWNVPAISLLTCLIVFAYSLASEGITGRGRVASLTVLDERCHRATTIGYLSFYCPLTPSLGPQFGVDTDVTLLSNQYEPWRRYRPADYDSVRLIDWTNNQLLASGWVNARVPAYFQIRKNEDRRERLTVEPQADGSLKVVNALGADIKRLFLADASGNVFEAQEIEAGAERVLAKPVEGKKAASVNGLSDLHNTFTASEWLNQFWNITQSDNAPALLVPNSYVAILSESPFVEKPLSGINSEDTSAIVFGLSKGSDHGR